MQLTIRPVSDQDLLPLSRFFERNDDSATTRQFHPFPLTERSAYRIALEPRVDRYYLAYQGEQLVGLAMLRGWDEGYEIPSFGILVDRAFHNQGVGKQVTRFVLTEAKNIGCKKIRLSVYEGNGIALHLYTSVGFKEISRTAVSINGESDTKITMENEIER